MPGLEPRARGPRARARPPRARAAPAAMSFFDDDCKRFGVTVPPPKSADRPYAGRWLAGHIELSWREEAILKTDGESHNLQSH